MQSNNLKYLGLLLIITIILAPIESKGVDLWTDWGVEKGEEYEFSLDICTKYGSTAGVSYTLGAPLSDFVAIQGDHWTVAIDDVNESGLFQTITKDSSTLPSHEYPTYKYWFWGQAGNRTYWQEMVDAYNDANFTENNPALYVLDEWTLIGDIYTEHRVYTDSGMNKFSIHIGKGITTEYELKYDESNTAVAYHHLKFSLITELESSTTTTTTTPTTSGGLENDSDDIISNALDFFTENPEITIVLFGGVIVLAFAIVLLRKRGGSKKRRRRR